MLVTNDWNVLALRLGAATLVGLVLGLDRELRGRDAGLRTHALVALSSALITISSLLVYEATKDEGSRADPLRVIQGIAQAIGFIAAGLIFVHRGDVRNLTTAANLWMAAAAGIVAGLGQFRLLLCACVLTLGLLLSEKLLPKRWRMKREPYRSTPPEV
ncbi:MAG: MgtC/SapB family protein [Sphingobium sp.]|uniref:MgtC/SapB family protein n=1 Tax=Sphingobium sp. TaxID=1912891 RepID=UPI0029BB5A01|nr:MgtC/SapB family protein [Sphingobium sp.]MDX3910231.1 MgtC/SapB family protein [Sphingobium sp.]